MGWVSRAFYFCFSLAYLLYFKVLACYTTLVFDYEFWTLEVVICVIQYLSGGGGDGEGGWQKRNWLVWKLKILDFAKSHRIM